MKIKLKPWLEGWIVDMPEAVAKAMTNAGLAEAAKEVSRRPTAAAPATEPAKASRKKSRSS